VKKAITRFLGLKPFRVYRAYSLAGGNLSAAGMSFQGFFAIFAAVWIAFAATGIFLSGHPEMVQAVIDFINGQIPGLIGPSGAIKPADLTNARIFGWSGAFATVVLLFTAINLFEYTRVAMHNIFGVPRAKVNVVVLKLIDLLLALAYGLLLTITATAAVITVNFTSWAMQSLGLDTTRTEVSFLFQGITLVFLLFVDVVLIAAAIRILSGVAVPMRYLIAGSAIGGVALTVLKLASGYALNATTRNPLFASFVVFVGVLIWLNITSRIYLLTAAWIATTMREKGHELEDSAWTATRRAIAKSVLRRNLN
jgi:membrane protein